MKKFTLHGFNKNRTRKTKRWLGMLAFCATFLGGQATFAQIAQNYDFEDETLNGWTNAGTASFYGNPTAPCNGTYSALVNFYIGWGTYDTNTFTSPSIGTSDGTEASISFSYKVTNYEIPPTSAAAADTFITEIQWANSESGPWTTFYTIDENNHTPSLDCTTVNANFTPGIGDLYVRFDSELLDDAVDILIFLDDITIVQGDSPCFPPSALTASDITLTEATLGWTSDGDEFEIEWGSQGFVQGSMDGTIVTGITTNSYDLTVSTGGNYDFYVRQICDSGESTWTGPFSFHIFIEGDDCSAPIIIDALPYTTTDNTANYSDNPDIEGFPGASGCGSEDAYLNGNDVVYSYTADSSGTITLSVSETGTYTGIFAYANCDDIGTACIGGAVNDSSEEEIEFELNIEEGETYYFVISTWASPQTTAYTLEITQLTCSNPADLTATDITIAGATLGWTNDGDEFEIEWGPQGFDQGSIDGTIVTGLTTNSYEVTISENGNYDFYVRQICDSGESTWVGPFSFTIPCVSTTVPYIQDFDSAVTPNMPSCTSVENAGSGNNWVTYDGESYGFTGNHLRYTYNSNNDANSWFYTQGIELEAGTTYKVSYDYGGTGATFPEKLKVAYGTSPAVAAMTTILTDHTNVDSETPINNEVEFTPTTSGVHYFGFNAYSDADMFYLHLDNISIDVATDPCEDIVPPTIESPQSLEEGQTLADVEITEGENLMWYTDENLTEEADTTTTLTEGTHTFYVTQTVGECTSEAVEVVIDVTLGLSDFDTTQLKVYPNPTSGDLNISYTDTINQIEVYSLLGQKVMNQNFESNSVSLDISNLSNGSYILILHASGLKQQVKIIKK